MNHLPNVTYPQNQVQAAAKAGIGSDFSSGALIAGVTTNQGFQSPRMLGAAFMGVAVLLFIANFVYVFITNHYFPYVFIIAGPAGWAGLWLLLTGQPKTAPEGAAMWGRIGLGACLVIGLLTGLAAIAAVHL